jgi:hypothetical protein
MFGGNIIQKWAKNLIFPEVGIKTGMGSTGAKLTKCGRFHSGFRCGCFYTT